jgi:hypothetical protein
MTKVTLLLFCNDKTALQRVRDTIILTLKRELDHKAKAGEIKYSDEHQNFYCYVNAEVGVGSIPIPQGFYDSKPTIVLKEVQKDASEGT